MDRGTKGATQRRFCLPRRQFTAWPVPEISRTFWPNPYGLKGVSSYANYYLGNARVLKPSVSVVISALNEVHNISHVFARIPDGVHEVIIVDGLSVDDTVAIAMG